jgi:hypothetical protein
VSCGVTAHGQQSGQADFSVDTALIAKLLATTKIHFKVTFNF